MATFTVGDVVLCPADMGQPEYYGRVVAVEEPVLTSVHGVQYQWVHVLRGRRTPQGTVHVWPSHRLK